MFNVDFDISLGVSNASLRAVHIVDVDAVLRQDVNQFVALFVGEPAHDVNINCAHDCR